MVLIEQIGAPAFTLRVCPDGKFRYLSVNAAYSARTGLDADDVVGRTPYDIHDLLTAAWLCEFYQDAVNKRRLVEYDIKITLLLGDLWWRTALTPIVSPDGAVGTLLGICQDVTTEKRLEADLVARNQQLDLAIRMLKGATWKFDVHADRFEASPNLALLLGEAQPRHVTWNEWVERVVRDDRDLASCDKLLAEGAGEETVEFRFHDNGGNVRWARCRRTTSADPASYPIVCGVVVDVTDERERAAALELQATRDSLTGLLNRRGLKRAMPTPILPGTALVMVDLDGFKQINDNLGHVRGDAVLVVTAERLGAVAGAEATVARLGGDEFLAVVRARDADEAEQIHRRIADALVFSHEESGTSVPVTASVGFAWTGQGCDSAELVADADDDLYRNKRARKAAARAAVKAARSEVFTDRPRAAA